MTYKEKKLKELKESYKKAYSGILPEEVLEKGNSWYEDFLSSTIDELLGCLPENQVSEFTEVAELHTQTYLKGFKFCREVFLQNLEQKAGEL